MSILFLFFILHHFTIAQNFNRPVPSSLFQYELEPVEKRITAMYDIVGREIREIKADQLYIICYENSTKKMIYEE